MNTLNESKRYLIALLLVLISLVVLVGYDGNEGSDGLIQPNTIAEQHVIVSIEGNIIRGENVSGKGEGIYYTVEQFEQMGIDENDIVIGDTVLIAWSEYNYNNEEWDQIELVEIVE